MNHSLSIIIVNYNSTDFLTRCLASIEEQTFEAAFSVTVVDNASEDQDFSSLQRSYPDVQFILNSKNVGFSTACNQGIRARESEYYLLLNPDCLIQDRAIDRALSFLADRTEVGIVGCRVNHPDGTLQLACRRSIPTPLMALYRFSGLSFLFSRSKRFGAYNYTYQDPRVEHEVEAVSGSFLLFRNEVLETSGFLDEDFFLYGEDLDFCYRAYLKGWKIFYYPGAVVVHYKRVSSSRAAQTSNFHFYDAMEIFYRKHFFEKHGKLKRLSVLSGIRVLHWAGRFRQHFLNRSSVGSRR